MLNKIFSRDHRRVDCDNIVSSMMRTKPIGKTQSVATHINPIFLLMEMICNRQKGNKFATPMTNIKSIEFISCPFSEHKYEKSLLHWNYFDIDSWYPSILSDTTIQKKKKLLTISNIEKQYNYLNSSQQISVIRIFDLYFF